jgi:hypothetical protein
VGVSTNSTYSFTVTEDVELVAVFEYNVGIDEWTIDNGQLKIYPNPTRGELIIENGELKIENVEFDDVFGRNVLSHQFSTFNFQLSIFHLPSGIYFVRIQTDKGVITRKVVKN